MARFHLVLVVVLAFLGQSSYCFPLTNATNSSSSTIATEPMTISPNTTAAPSNSLNTTAASTLANATKTTTAPKEKKEVGPSNILYPVCSGFVGISNRKVIKDVQMYASSTHEVVELLQAINNTLKAGLKNSTGNSTEMKTKSNYTIEGNLTAAYDGRLGNTKGSWCASEDDGDQYLIVDLGHVKILEGVVTQGRSDSDNWVTEYMVSHSSNKKKWHKIKKSGEHMLFKGNKDRNSLAVGSFPHRIAARFIKFHPKAHHGKLMCMRVEAVGCHPDTVNVAKHQPTNQSSTKHNMTSPKAVDGHFLFNAENETCMHTHHENSPWLRIDLRRVYKVKEVFISNHGGRAGRDLRDAEVRVGNNLENEGNDNLLCSVSQTIPPGQIKTVVCNNETFGRYVNIRIPPKDFEKTTLSLCEVAVIGIAETVVKLGLEDIAGSLQTGAVTDKAGGVSDVIGGLMGQLKGNLGGALLSQLQGQGMNMLNNLKGQGMGMLNNLKGQGMGMLDKFKNQGLGMANKMKEQGMEMANKLKGKGMEMANKMKKQGMEMADKAKKQGMEMADKMKKQGMEMADKMKKQGMEMADKMKKQGMEMADKMKNQGMEMANQLQGQGMGMAKDMQKQGMGMVGDMQGQMNQQQDKFKKKLKEILNKGKDYLEIGKEEMEKFKKKGYIEKGKEYMDIGLGMTMDAIAHIQAKLMESMGNIAGDMSKQITTLSEYDTSDIKGLLDDVDPVPVREFVEEAKPKIGEYIDEMEKMVKKYIDIGIEKAEEAKKEIESEADSAASQATDLGKNAAGKATSMGKNMAGKAQAAGMKIANKAKDAGMSAVNKAKDAGMSAVNKAKATGMDAVNKAKAAGMDAVNKAKEAGMGALDKAKGMGMGALNQAKGMGMGALSQAKGMGMGAFGQLKQAGMGALGQAQGLGQGLFGKLSEAGRELLKKGKDLKPSQVKEMQQIQMLQQLKQMKKMKELQKQLEKEQDAQWRTFDQLNKEMEKEMKDEKDDLKDSGLDDGK